MKSPECLHILDNCMKNIKAKIKEICKMNQVTQDGITRLKVNTCSETLSKQ